MAERLYKGAGLEINVREEQWFPRYFMTNEYTLNNLVRKNPNVEVKMVGIQGDLTYGVRTKCEWTALQEDINESVRTGRIHVSPVGSPASTRLRLAQRHTHSPQHGTTTTTHLRRLSPRCVPSGARSSSVTSGRRWNGQRSRPTGCSSFVAVHLRFVCLPRRHPTNPSALPSFLSPLFLPLSYWTDNHTRHLQSKLIRLARTRPS